MVSEAFLEKAKIQMIFRGKLEFTSKEEEKRLFTQVQRTGLDEWVGDGQQRQQMVDHAPSCKPG